MTASRWTLVSAPGTSYMFNLLSWVTVYTAACKTYIYIYIYIMCVCHLFIQTISLYYILVASVV